MIELRHTQIEEDASPEEWDYFAERIKALSDDQVVELAAALGIVFSDPAKVTAEDYRLVLDESCWDDLARQYQAVTGQAF